jgi:hypothetical protein
MLSIGGRTLMLLPFSFSGFEMFLEYFRENRTTEFCVLYCMAVTGRKFNSEL